VKVDCKKLIKEHSNSVNGFNHPRWDEIADLVNQNYNKDEFDSAYSDIAREWLFGLKVNLDEGFKVYESDHFLLLCNQEDVVPDNLINACERSLKTITEQFSDSLNRGFGKHVVILFNGVKDYTEYTSGLFGGDEGPATSGMCIRLGYTHIVIPMIHAKETPTRVIAHELTHVLTTSYGLPNWLDEAIAMRMEDVVEGADSLFLDEESYQQHLEYWNSETIQDFWSGVVWGQDSKGFELAYTLAMVIWKKLAVNLAASKEEIVELMETLSLDDGGNAAVKSIFDYSLGDLVTEFLGEGEWEPDVGVMMKQKEFQQKADNWIEEIKPLIKMDEADLLESSLKYLKPSGKLSELFESLEVITIQDLTEVTAKSVYVFRDRVTEVEDELSIKLQCLNLSALGLVKLIEISDVLFIFRYGKIKEARLNNDQCILVIEAKYLAEMIDPSYRDFAVILEGFGGFGYEEWADEEGEELISMSDLLKLKPIITGSEILTGRVSVSFGVNDNLEADPTNGGGAFSFYADSMNITDAGGNELGFEELKAIETEYWEGA